MAHVARRHSPVVDVTAIVTVFCPMGEDPLRGAVPGPSSFHWFLQPGIENPHSNRFLINRL